MNSYDVVNGLSHCRQLKRYLEISTPETGQGFNLVVSEGLETQHRLLYRCPESYNDGLEVTFRTTAEGSHDLIRTIQAIQRPDQKYDLILIKSYHTYAASIADLHGAFCLLRPGGVLVVRGCNPLNLAATKPHQSGNDWCGLTYQAFIDFIFSAHPAGYCVVDCDHGCAVVFSQGAVLPDGLSFARPGQPVIFAWNVAASSGDAQFAYFDRNRKTLLNLISPTEFTLACDMPVPVEKPDAAHDRTGPVHEHYAPEGQHRSTDLEARFTRVYSTNQWEDSESISGPGSRLNSGPVVETLAVLRKICTDYGVQTLNDIPCGDLNWIVKFIEEFPSVNYAGFDIVLPLIERNRSQFPKLRCSFLDITSQIPPRANLVLCKDLTIHLSDEDIVRSLSNIKASGSDYLLLSNNFGQPNSDLLENIHGDSACRYVDILTPPFSCSQPVWKSEYLGLWKLDTLKINS